METALNDTSLAIVVIIGALLAVSFRVLRKVIGKRPERQVEDDDFRGCV